MTSLKRDTESLVKDYQEGHDGEELLSKFNNFLNKYHQLLYHGVIDFNNYDIRSFLSCYLKDKEERSSLLKGKYHSTQDVTNGYKISKYLQQAFKNYSAAEVFHELVIPFLECAKRYKDMNKGFASYLYNSYRYELVRHINSILFQRFNEIYPLNHDVNFEIILEEDMDRLQIDMDDDLVLNHPEWLSGKTAEPPFQQLTRQDRLILIKYYMEDYTDKEIGRLVGRHRKSINRTRLRVVEQLKKEIMKGEIKWIRWLP